MKSTQGSNNNTKKIIQNSPKLKFSKLLYVSPSKTKSIVAKAFASFKAKALQAWNTIYSVFHNKHNQEIPVKNIRDPNILNPNSNSDAINFIPVVNTSLKNEVPDAINSISVVNTSLKNEVPDAINSIPVVNTSLKNEVNDGPYSLENAKAFLAYFEKNANWDDISPVAVKYAHDLVVKHADTSEEEFNLKPVLRSNVENAKKLITQSNLNENKKLENLSLGTADLLNELLKNFEVELPSDVKNLKKELPFEVKNPTKELSSEVNKELSAKEKYLNDWSDYVIQAFYPENYSNKDNPGIIQTKHEAKIFLDWKEKWSNIKFEGDEAPKSKGEEGAKRVKNYYKEAFNAKNQMSIEELDACNRFIRKHEFIFENSSSGKKQEIENLELQQYVDDFLEFYKDEQIKILTEKNSEITVGNASQEKFTNVDLVYIKAIPAFQDLISSDIQRLKEILAPDLDLPAFEVFMVNTKKYFESIATGITPIENQKGAALTIAALWTGLTGNTQAGSNADVVSHFTDQISQFFIKNPVAKLKNFLKLVELEKLPNFDKLNVLFDLEKISKDFE